MNVQNKKILVLGIIVAVGLGWYGFRPVNQQSDFELVKGNIVTQTALTKEGKSEFELRIWLDDKSFFYSPTVKVHATKLDEAGFENGAAVEMLALKKHIEKPFRGLLNNVEPRVYVSALKVNGNELISWDEYNAKQDSDRKFAKIIALVALVGGVLGGLFSKPREE